MNCRIMYTTSIFLISILMKNKIFKRSAKIISEMTDYITATPMVTDYSDCMLKGIDVVNIGNSYMC